MNEVENNIKNYITVKEYSEICGVSYQSIYKKLKNADNELNKYVKYFNNQRMINRKALIDINGIVDEYGANKVENEVEQSCTIANKVENHKSEDIGQETSSKIIIDLLNDRIKAQEQELNVKNQQIETLQEQLSNSQKLLAMEKQEKQALLESGNAENVGVIGHIKKLIFGKKSSKVEK